jgi:hypothetical protein
VPKRGASETSHEAWNPVLSGFGGSVRTYPLSVGTQGGAPIQSKNPDIPVTFQLIVFPVIWTTVASIALILLFIIFTVLAIKTDMLKDPPQAGNPRTYSLGRCQMAWWFFIVMASFTFIWLVTGDVSVPPSSLVLLAISSATALSAVIVDPRPKKTLYDKANVTGASSFFSSLLDDGDGASFHRFQIVAWTILLGIVFISKVVNELAQPTLDANLLTLMGISSGIYIGFKFQERSPGTV